MDTYEKTFDQPIDMTQALIRFHASDADEIHHGQLMYELGSSAISEIFSLHPFTGDLSLLSNEPLQSDYQFDVYVYDRHRKNLIDDRMKTKARVQLHFHQRKIRHRRRTIFNQTIEFREEISSYQLNYSQRNSWTLLTVHQPILAIEVNPPIESMEIFILNTSSKNSIDLFTSDNQIYADNVHLQEYHLHLLLCFSNRTKCQSTSYHLIPSIDFSTFRFRFPSIPSLVLSDDLPQHSFIHHFRLQYESIADDEPFLIHYHLLNSSSDFNLDPTTGVLRLGKGFNYRQYQLNVQAEISFLNQIYSLSTTVQIGVQETNKYRPVFHHDTPRDIHHLPHRFEAIDFDENGSTNGRVSYRLWNCSVDCPFQIHPNNGVLSRRRAIEFKRDRIYSLQIVAFDWGELFRLDTTMDVRIDLSTKLTKRELSSWDSISIVSKIDRWPLSIGFAQNVTIYHLSEDTPVDTIIDLLDMKSGPLPPAIDQNRDRLFFLIIDDPSAPFVIDQTEKSIRLISSLDREKVDHYTFTIELRLRPTSLLKFQSNQANHQRMLVHIHIEDVNDHIPRCSHFHRSISVYENKLRANLYRVQAIDPDRGENGTVTYSLLNYQQYFTIDAQTGQIDLIRPIDREELAHLRLYVIASDQGRPSSLHSICTTLHLTIIDRNDHVPQFSRNQYTHHLFADLPRYTIFGQIHAIDADHTDQLIYSIEPNPYVTIDSRSGYLRLQENPQNAAIHLSVNVSDGVHVNQTSVQIAVQASQEPQQPILVAEPALSVMINRSTVVGTRIAAIYDHFPVARSSIDHMEIVDEEEGGSAPFSIDRQGIAHIRNRVHLVIL